ncbi:MAG: thymidine kinase, partial [bacterium]
MAKLYFKHGTMDASKSADLLMTAHKYEQQGKKIICLRPSLDTRTEKGFIKSRALLDRHPALCIDESFDIFSYIESYIKNLNQNLNCILIDEAQFLSKLQIEQLVHIVDFLDVPIICYGLKNSYISGQLFEGSSALLYYADSIQEIKSVCHFCDSKATMHLRIENNLPTRSSNTNTAIIIGDTKVSESYYIST